MEIIKTALTVGLFLDMFAQGLRLRSAHLLKHPHEPRKLARAFVAVDVLVPLAALAVAAVLRPPQHVVVALSLMAASPMAGFALHHAVRNPELRKTWSAIHLVLLAAAVVTTPLTLHLLGAALGFRAHVSPIAIGGTVVSTVALPLTAGMLFRHRRPDAAARIAEPIQKAGYSLVALSFVVVLGASWRALGDFGPRGYLAVALFVGLSLSFGHLLGGANPRERTLLAVETATRNPALALVIAQTSFPKAPVATTLVPYVVTYVVLTNAYRFWRRQRPSGGAGTRGRSAGLSTRPVP